jgi:hypothetical protein
MTQRILAHPGRLTTEHNNRWWTLGAMWTRELIRTLTDAEREALAEATALLLERSDLAACRPQGL